MTQQDLIASLTAVQDAAAVYLDEDRYFDWSIRHNGTYLFEAGSSSDVVVQLDLTRDEMLRLQAALTLTLLRDGE
jgi:hypothetical protein